MGRGGKERKGSARTIRHAWLDDEAVDQPVRPGASGSSCRGIRCGPVGRECNLLGKLRDGEQIYKGEHAGIVDADLWERANAAVNRWQSCARVEPCYRSESRTAAQSRG